MQIILKQDVENLGLEFDTVDVKPGYARNFLIPRGKALLATPKNKADLAATLDARKEEEAKLIAAANEKVAQLKAVEVSIAARVGTGDKLFGSVNNNDLVEALAGKGVEIERKYIRIPGNTIKRLGQYVAKIRLHREVEYEFNFSVVPDEESKARAAKKAEARAAEKAKSKAAEEAAQQEAEGTAPAEGQAEA